VHEGILGGILQMVSIAIPTFFLSRALDAQQAHLGGEEQILPGVWFALFGQHLGIACLTASALLLAARWRWPSRFASDWINSAE
jgi:hypothetical protein